MRLAQIEFFCKLLLWSVNACDGALFCLEQLLHKIPEKQLG